MNVFPSRDHMSSVSPVNPVRTSMPAIACAMYTVILDVLLYLAMLLQTMAGQLIYKVGRLLHAPPCD